MSGELKPCPFCGGDAEIQELGNRWLVVCIDGEECGVQGHVAAVDAYAVEAWNRRADATLREDNARLTRERDEARAEIDRLRGCLRVQPNTLLVTHESGSEERLMLALSDAEAALAKARAVALEEAAKVADDHGEAWGLAHKSPAVVIAAAIRALAKETAE